VKDIKYNSIACIVIIRVLLAAWPVLWCILPVPGMAGTVYQWTDAAGVTHFSDTAPLDPPADSRELETVPAPAVSAQGLRPGERANLQVIEQRLKQQRRTTQLARQRNDRAMAEHRRDCRERRERQRSTGNHPARKALTTYLRRNCW
jgi:hypothetical protein